MVMEMDWGSISGGGNTPFMTLESGVNQIRIVGRPYQIEIHWEKGLDGGTKRIICPGPECPLCKIGRSPSSRYQVQVINRKTNKVEILEGGPAIFGAIKDYALDPDYGDPTQYDIRIKKEGSLRNTKYSVVASPNKKPLTPEEQGMVAEMKSLSEVNKPKTPDEIHQMGLEVLAGSAMDLNDSDWEEPLGSKGGSNESDFGFSDDDWNSI